MVTPVPAIVSRLDVVFLYVRDMRRALAFYRDVLGIPLEGDDRWAEADLGGTRFALHQLHGGVDEPSSGTIHMDFAVGDVDAAAATIRSAGFDVGETVRDDWGAAVGVTDPDGYRVYLYEPARRR